MLNAINLGTWDSIVLSSKEEWKIIQEEFQREERKEMIHLWEDNVINSSSDLENKIISLGIMMKDDENGEEQSRYSDNNFSKHMACIKDYSYFFPR